MTARPGFHSVKLLVHTSSDGRLDIDEIAELASFINVYQTVPIWNGGLWAIAL